MFPTGTIITIVTNDRRHEAETARPARRAATDEQPQAPRRIRAFATRIAFAAQR